MEKASYTFKFLRFYLLSIILLGLPVSISCQLPSNGKLNFIRGNDWTDHFVKINNQQLIDGQTIESPFKVEVPIDTEVLVDLSNTGLLKLDSDTKMDLVFDETRITGSLVRGTLTVKVPPNIKLSIKTIDGLISTPNQNQENSVTIKVVNNKTQVGTVFGCASFNGVLIASGESITSGEISNKYAILKPRPSIFFNFIASILYNFSSSEGPTSRSNFGAEQTNVGPMK